MLSCKDITEKANQYLDHDLPFMVRLNFRIHLFMCVNCKRYVQQLRTTILTLGRMKQKNAVDNQVVENVIGCLKQHEQTGSDTSK